MIGEICQYLKNWFDEDSKHNRLPRWSGTFSIVDSELHGLPGSLYDGQWFRVIDSNINDGVYQWPAKLKDEVFDGTIQSMRVPTEIVQLDADIEAWLKENEKAINSPYMSENLPGVYSYTLRVPTGADGADSGLTWQKQFKSRLAPWRKL